MGEDGFAPSRRLLSHRSRLMLRANSLDVKLLTQGHSVGRGLLTIGDLARDEVLVLTTVLTTILTATTLLALGALGSVDTADDAGQVLSDETLLLIQGLRVLESRDVEGLADHGKLLGREAGGPAVVVEVHLVSLILS